MPTLTLNFTDDDGRVYRGELKLTLVPTEPAEKVKPKGYVVPDCPHQIICNLYHNLCPLMPRALILSPARQAMMRARWREVCAEEKLTSEQAQDFFAAYFTKASRSDFLNGRVAGMRKSAWVASLDWLMNRTNFVKVLEGKYQ